MSEWKKISELQDEWIQRGCVLRVPRTMENDPDWYPDPFTDFLVFDANRSYGLMVLSGSKAGLTRIVFPADSSLPGSVGLSSEWLRKNWTKWVYPNGQFEDVLIRKVSFVCAWNQ